MGMAGFSFQPYNIINVRTRAYAVVTYFLRFNNKAMITLRLTEYSENDILRERFTRCELNDVVKAMAYVNSYINSDYIFKFYLTENTNKIYIKAVLYSPLPGHIIVIKDCINIIENKVVPVEEFFDYAGIDIRNIKGLE